MKYIVISIIIFLIIFIYSSIRLSSFSDIDILEDDDNTEWIYEVALNSFSYTESVVDTIVEELKLHGYIDNNKQITARGTDYLKHHTVKDRKERTGANKRQILDSKIKIKTSPKKIAYTKEDTVIYDDINTLNKVADVYAYEGIKVYDEIDSYYLTEIDGNVGYINKDITEDLTGTFVIVDISNQELNLYENNKLILTSPVVTGKPSTPTSVGSYNIFEISRNRDLIGPNYRSYVNIMMKFNGGQGLHDAEYHVDDNGKRHGWRNKQEFGGSTYLYNGSHGCVNMPHDEAIEVSNYVNIGDKVLVKK